ncbi:PepSY domain-containing protein [Muricoccus vinaceus]|uniref:PepSY domain-containing protein n=1 Tax=Muricoccus vinaceus TaxID=424704 RepID=A0ABV6IVR2_9PROT
MIRNRILSAALAGTLAAFTVGGAALAAPEGQRQRGSTEHQTEAAAVLGARIAPADAVTAAERIASGRAVKLSMEHENGARLYEVRVASGDQMVTVIIDPSTGAGRAIENQGFLSRLLDRADKDELQAMLQASTTLGQAIAAAEHAAGSGRAVEASWEDDGQAHGYEVEVAREGGSVTKLFVDAASGQARVVGQPALNGNRGQVR